MVGKAAGWVSSFLTVKPMINWVKFSVAARAKFKDEILETAIDKFLKLTQTNSLEDYIDAFEYGKSLMEMHGYELSFKFLLDTFLNGLLPHFKPFVKAFKPKTITQAVEYAHLQYDAFKSTHKQIPLQKSNHVSSTSFKPPSKSSLPPYCLPFWIPITVESSLIIIHPLNNQPKYLGKFDLKGMNFALFASKGSNLRLFIKGSNFGVCSLLKMFR